MDDETLLTIIRGDTLEIEVEILDFDSSLINKVFFTCEDFDICKEFTKVENKYYLKITDEETELFDVTRTFYDVTMQYNLTDMLTLIYKGSFIVLDKINGVSCI